jgi:hypothetical protein
LLPLRFDLAMPLVLLILTFFVFSSGFTQKQTLYTVSGFVKDSLTSENLTSATIYVPEVNRGAVANDYGYFSLTLAEGSYTFRFSYAGYQTITLPIELKNDIKLNVSLPLLSKMIQEVVVKGDKGANVESTNMGRQELSMETVKSIPALFGEIDVLKTLQLLPGVKGGGEGNTGFYVRGGGPDQNLVLLDDAVVYNTGHLFGFFSVFNSDAIKNTTLIKGGMPAEYGGRLSSVVDISMKEGNMKRFNVEGGLGLISSRLTVQGPIWKDRISFIVSGRRTYADLISRPILKNIQEGRFAGNAYYFYDLNGKVNFRISDKDRIYFSGYYGKDVFDFQSPNGTFQVNFPWGNATATAKWNHVWNDKLFSNLMFVFNDFRFETNTRFKDVRFKVSSFIRDYTAKMDFDYAPILGHQMKFGAQYIYHTFTPYQATATSSDVNINSTSVSYKYAHESALYFQDDWEVNHWLKMNLGVRFSMFNFVGPYRKVLYDQNNKPTDTLNYSANKPIQTYYGVEPRISARFKTDKYSSIKAGFTMNRQYIHLVTSSTTTLPLDLWVPSTGQVKPQTGLQASVGYFRNFLDDMLETSVEVYYKHMWNQIEYAEDKVQNVAADVEDLFAFGTGYSYGAEFFIKKAKGRFQGWIGYTLSWTWRKFPEIDGGEKFLQKYDRRHDLSVVVMYDITKRLKVSGTFVFSSGARTTLPISFYLLEGQPHFIYGKRNFYQLPAYHRMDFGLTYVLSKKSKFYHDLNFSVYNVYNRLNPFFLYVDIDGEVGGNSGGNGQTNESLRFKANQVSLFPIIPTLTWNFKF